MRKLLVFILVLQIVSGNGLGSEIAKASNLVQHYQVHRGATMFDFLRLHYADRRHHQSDPAHHQLPMQHFSCHSISLTVLPEPIVFHLHPGLDSCYTVLHAEDETWLPADFRTRLLRPPQVFFS